LSVSALTCSIRDAALPGGSIDALSEVTLRADAGTLCAVVGPNGAGKTTLLRAIAGVVKPTRGDVTLNGRSLTTMSAAERAKVLALLPQRPVMPSGLTVREGVAWGRFPHVGRLAHAGPTDLAVVDDALARTGANHLADRIVDSLSGGEHQRAAIARALAQTPSVLLVDEPTVHLDLGHQLEIMELLQRLAAEGLIVIAVLHDLNLAARYADELLLLHRGRVLASGPPAAVIEPDRIARAYGAIVSIETGSGSTRPRIVVQGPVAQSAGHGA
jgi:iron complex transport system ATP-binding protein